MPACAVEGTQERGEAQRRQENRDVDRGSRQRRCQQRHDDERQGCRREHPVARRDRAGLRERPAPVAAPDRRAAIRRRRLRAGLPERAAADAVPVERTQHCQRRHRRQQITFIALAGQAEDDEQRDDPHPQQSFVVTELGATTERDHEHGGHRKHEQAGVQRIRHEQPPDAGAAPEEVLQVAARRGELAGVFLEHEFLNDRARIRVECKPQPEHCQCHDGQDRELARIACQEQPERVAPVAQMPPRDPETNRQQQRERLVEQADSRREPEQNRRRQARVEHGRPPEEPGEAGDEQPEHRGRVGQERPAVAVRAEEREKRQQARRSPFQAVLTSSSQA